MELTITYIDGTTKAVILTEENMVYDFAPWQGLWYQVMIDGYALTIKTYNGQERRYVANYLGVECDIKDIAFTDSNEIDSIEIDNVSLNGDGMIVKVKYTDGTSETLTIDIVDMYDWSDLHVSFDAYTKTENGLLHYSIETYIDENGKAERYRVCIFDKEIFVEAESVVISNVDGDGAVNNKDVTLLRRYLVGGLDVTIDTVAADINKDGSVNNKDVTLLRRYLVGGWGVTLQYRHLQISPL